MKALVYRLADAARARFRSRHWSPDQATGRLGDALAHRFLRRSGYVVVARNYRASTGTGEIDLVAWDGDTLVFIEVKTRASEEFGAPDRAIDREKEFSIQRAARNYARRSNADWERS